MRALVCGATLCLGAIAAGCAGSRHQLAFDQLKVPVSMSEAIYGPAPAAREAGTLTAPAEGEALPADSAPVAVSASAEGLPKVLHAADLEVVGQLDCQVRLWGMAWGFVSLSDPAVIDRAINEQVERARGEGVVNLILMSENCGINSVMGPNILPFWPGCTMVTVRGDVVRRGRQE